MQRFHSSLILVQHLICLAILITTASSSSSSSSSQQQQQQLLLQDDNVNHRNNNHDLLVVVTATTPFLHPRDRNPFAKDRALQAPYVHWTCHYYYSEDDDDNDDFIASTTTTSRTTTTTATTSSQKLQCCQTIYQVMLTDPVQLCWDKKGCGQQQQQQQQQKEFNQQQQHKAAVDKADFLHHCTQNIATLIPMTTTTTTTTANRSSSNKNNNDNDDDDDKEARTAIATTTTTTTRRRTRRKQLQPRYTLLQAPEGVTLNIRIWAQAVGIQTFVTSSSRSSSSSSSSGSSISRSSSSIPSKQLAVHWFYEEQVTSPLQIATKAYDLLPPPFSIATAAADDDDDDDDDAAAETTNSNKILPLLFGLNLTSVFAADPDKDEHYYLRHVLEWNDLPSVDALRVLSENNNNKTDDSLLDLLQVTVVLFLPQDVALKPHHLTFPCKPACSSSSSWSSSISCQVNVHPETSKTSVDQPNEIVVLQVDISNLNLASLSHDNNNQKKNDDDFDSSTCRKIQWMTPLLLDDDEETYLLTAPVIQDAYYFLVHTTSSSTSSSSSNTNKIVAEWNGLANMSAPILANVETAWWKKKNDDEL